MRKKSEKESGFFKKNLQEGWNYIKDSKKFIYFSSALFVLFIFIGYFVPAPEYISNIIQKFVEELFQKTDGLSWTQLVQFIFLNNIQSSFFGMILGFFLGLFSIAVIVVNGYLLGFVASKVVNSEGILTLWRLLPHGVFEIPAILISVGLGLKLGTFIFQKDKSRSLKIFLIKSLKAFFFIVVPLLIIAAIIESSLIFFIG